METSAIIADLVCAYVIAVVGVHLLVGMLGAVPLSHVATMGVSAYVYSLSSTRLGLSTPASLCLAVFASLLLAFVFNLITLRLTDQVFSLATFGFHLLFFSAALSFTQITGGPMGVKQVPWVFGFESDLQQTSCCVVGAIGALFLYYRIWRSPLGVIARATRDELEFSRGIGVDTALIRLQVLMVSSCLWAIAGVLLASVTGYIEPSSFLLEGAVSLLAVAFLVGRRGSVVRIAVATAGVLDRKSVV